MEISERNSDKIFNLDAFTKKEILGSILAIFVAAAAISLGITALKAVAGKNVWIFHSLSNMNELESGLVMWAGMNIWIGYMAYLMCRRPGGENKTQTIQNEEKKHLVHRHKINEQEYKEDISESIEQNTLTMEAVKIDYPENNTMVKKWVENNSQFILETFHNMGSTNRMRKTIETDDFSLNLLFIKNSNPHKLILDIENKKRDERCLSGNKVDEFYKQENLKEIEVNYKSKKAYEKGNCYIKQIDSQVEKYFEELNNSVADLKKKKKEETKIQKKYSLVIKEFDKNGEVYEAKGDFSHRLYIFFRIEARQRAIDVFYDDTNISYEETNRATTDYSQEKDQKNRNLIKERRDRETNEFWKKEKRSTNEIRVYRENLENRGFKAMVIGEEVSKPTQANYGTTNFKYFTPRVGFNNQDLVSSCTLHGDYFPCKNEIKENN